MLATKLPLPLISKVGTPWLDRKHVSRGAFGNDLDRSDVSANNRLYDGANYLRVLSQYSIHHQTTLVMQACEILLAHYRA
jgi:hypothetical protein